MIKYFNKKKREWFPEITDWTDPQIEKRWKSPDQMTWDEWFFFSPHNFKIVHFGLPLVSIAVFLPISVWFIIRELWLLGIITLIISVHQIFKLIQKIKLRKSIQSLNFYDLWLRE